jgi:hypothetical protein
LHKLNFYQDEYIPRNQLRNKYNDESLPNGINRFIKPKRTPPEELAKLSNGDMHAVKSYVKLEFIKHYIGILGGEVRSFPEVINPHITRVESVISKFIEIKKVMKINMNLKLLVKRFSANEGYDSQTGLTITHLPQEIDIPTEGTEEINKNNYREILGKLYSVLAGRIFFELRSI